MLVIPSKRICGAILIVMSLAIPHENAAAQAIAHNNVTAALVAAVEDSAAQTPPALLLRLGISKRQAAQIRVAVRQHRMERQSIVDQMLSASSVDAASNDQTGRGVYLQRLQEIDRAQHDDIDAILTQGQLISLKQLAPDGTIVIPQTPGAVDRP